MTLKSLKMILIKIYNVMFASSSNMKTMIKLQSVSFVMLLFINLAMAETF